MTHTFVEFVDRKQRETIRHLKLVKGALTKGGLQVTDHIQGKNDDPYLFVYNPTSEENYGIRIYKIGDQLAYRIQRREKTHPYGQAYPLDVEAMWDDFRSDGMKTHEAVRKLVKSLVKEIKEFFKKSAKATKELRKQSRGDEGPLGYVNVRSTTGTDYSSTVTSS